jgi:hypothetical protein
MARQGTHLWYSAKSLLPTDLPILEIRFNKRAREKPWIAKEEDSIPRS